MSKKVDINKFLNIEDEEISYILGFIWADGYIRKPQTIFISLSIKDIFDIKRIFMETGDWNCYERNRIDNRNGKTYGSFSLHTCNRELVNFL